MVGAGVLLGLILSWIPSDKLRATLLCVMVLIFLDLHFQVLGLLHRFVSVQEGQVLRYLGLFVGFAASDFSRPRTYFFLFQGYDGLRRLLNARGLANLPRGNRRSYALHSLGTLATLQKLKTDIVTGPAAGRMFFTHLMLPHQPYFLTADCRVREFDDWDNRKLYHDDLNKLSSKQFRAEAYQRYFEQSTCLLRILDDLFDAMQEQGIFDNPTIIVHGDHGSRITIRDPVFENVERLSSRDLIDAYSALFAIRIPGVAGGYDTRMRSVQDLFGEYVLDLPPKELGNRIYLAPSEQYGIQPYDMPPMVD